VRFGGQQKLLSLMHRPGGREGGLDKMSERKRTREQMKTSLRKRIQSVG